MSRKKTTSVITLKLFVFTRKSTLKIRPLKPGADLAVSDSRYVIDEM